MILNETPARSASEGILSSARRSPRWRFGLVFALAAIVASARADEDVDRSELLSLAQAKAQATKVMLLGGAAPQAAELSPTPLLSYADNPRGIHDARLWLFQNGKQPAALLKTEYMTVNGRPKWVYCFASWSVPRVELTLSSGQKWTSSKPGIDWSPLPAAPAAAGTPTARLRQLKDAARRFAATSFDDASAAGAQEMRLLNQPLHRYADPDTELIDAALFGLTNNGTNPDLVLALEIVRGTETSEWRFAASQMTTARLHLRLDDREVWTAPYVRTNPGRLHDQERWMFVSETPQPGEKGQ